MRKYNPKSIILLSLGLFTMVNVLFLNPVGHFSIDEGVYHLMARSFSESGSLEIWNGYNEFPSPELVLSNVRVHEGRLVPQYPYLYPVIAYPFYKLAGFHGLFVLNAIAFLGVVGLCFALARKLFHDLDLALNASLILVLATFAWEYSQAAWPHAASMLFTTGAVYISLLASNEKRFGKSMALAFAAGMVAGFGAGVRLDVFFVFPVIVAPHFFARPWRPCQALAASIGTIPGLLVLAATNCLKFGTAAPFSYGSASGNTSGIGPYLPLAAFALAGIAGAWVFTRIPYHSLRRSTKLFIGLIAAAMGISIIPAAWNFISRLAFGAYQLIVDLRVRNLDIVEPALIRTRSGALSYLNLGLKKTLLQSCPYLPSIALPLMSRLRNEKTFYSLGSLYLASAIYIFPFSFFAWHGGLSFNMRYFLPALPFTSIITAYTYKRLTSGLNRYWCHSFVLAGFLTYAVYCFSVLLPKLPPQQEEAVYLTLPIILALGLFLLLFAQIVAIGNARIILQGTSCVVLVTSLVWSGMVAFSYDYSRALVVRSAYSNISQKVSSTISSNSIFFTDFPDPFYGLFEMDRVRLAIPANDNFQDFSALINFHLDAGHPVYASFCSETWQSINTRQLLNSQKTVPLLEHQFGSLVQISPKTGD